jgi:hypothetical protein
MHDWYFSSTLEEAPTSSLIGTCFMEDLAYIYGIHHFCGIGWCMVMYMFGTLIDGICFMILHLWYYLINTTIGICLRYLIVALGS